VTIDSVARLVPASLLGRSRGRPSGGLLQKDEKTFPPASTFLPGTHRSVLRGDRQDADPPSSSRSRALWALRLPRERGRKGKGERGEGRGRKLSSFDGGEDFFAGAGCVRGCGTGSERVDLVAAFVFRVRSLRRRVISSMGSPQAFSHRRNDRSGDRFRCWVSLMGLSGSTA
jgi:hypothetical protein